MRGEIPSAAATSLALRPSASNCRISRWRGVSDATGSVAFFESGFIACRTSPVSVGVMNVLPSSAAPMAITSSAGAECFST